MITQPRFREKAVYSAPKVSKRIDPAFQVEWPCKWDVTFDWESKKIGFGRGDTLDRTDAAPAADDDDDEVASKSVRLLFGSHFCR